MPKIVLLIVASQGYQPIEYGHTRKSLEDAGIKVVIASNKPGTAHSKPCDDPSCNKIGVDNADYTKAPVDVTLNELKQYPRDYDGIFIIGGPGALECLDNETTYAVMKTFAAQKNPFGAICISPRILARAGLLKGKKATCWDDDNKVKELFKKHEVTYIDKPVVVDGAIITANGPQAALDFGKTIAAHIKPQG